MNKEGLAKRATALLRLNNARKPISGTRQVFHISDDQGNTKDFVIKKGDKGVLYTIEDVRVIINAIITVIEDAMKQGEEVSLHGFGKLGVKYRKPRRSKDLYTKDEITIEGRYVPSFTFGNDLRRCARIYEENKKRYENNQIKVNPDTTDDYMDGE